MLLPEKAVCIFIVPGDSFLSEVNANGRVHVHIEDAVSVLVEKASFPNVAISYKLIK